MPPNCSPAEGVARAAIASLCPQNATGVGSALTHSAPVFRCSTWGRCRWWLVDSQPNITFSPRWRMTAVVAGGWQESRTDRVTGSRDWAISGTVWRRQRGHERQGPGSEPLKHAPFSFEADLQYANLRHIYKNCILWQGPESMKQQEQGPSEYRSLCDCTGLIPWSHVPMHVETDGQISAKFVEFLQLLFIFLISNVFNWEAEGRRDGGGFRKGKKKFKRHQGA